MGAVFRPIIVASLFALSAAAADGAHATTFCNIKQTGDGFVALRAGPSASSRMVAKMRVGDEIQAHSEQKGPWIRATWWKGGRFKVAREAGYDPSNGVGWVHAKLLEEDSCG